MLVESVICDRCSDVIDNEKAKVYYIEKQNGVRLDLCNKCYDSFIDWFWNTKQKERRNKDGDK